MEELNIRVANIHCDACEATIARCLKSMGLEPATTLGSNGFIINRNDITVNGESLKYKKIVKEISKVGFKILSWDLTKLGNKNMPIDEAVSGEVEDEDRMAEMTADAAITDAHTILLNLFRKWQKTRQSKKHIDNCRQCKEEEEAKRSSERETEDSSDDANTVVATVVGKQEKEYRVVLTIEGMTCGSCVKAVEEQVELILNENQVKSLDGTKLCTVSLLLHTAVVILPNKHLINKIIDGIDAAGFECRLVEALPVERSINTKIVAAIGGITCSACAGSIQNAVKNLNFVLDCDVNVISKTGTFVLLAEGSNLEKLQETIEDIGYDYEELSNEPVNYTSSKKKSRTINVSVEGMFCGHCPDLIVDYLSSFGEAVIIEDNTISLDHPFIKFTYLPNPDSQITVRRFLHDINHLVASDSGENSYVVKDAKGPFTASLVQSISMDQRLKELSRSEIMKIVKRLAIATLFGIPTFIFGIVVMSFLPQSNSFRMWCEEPIWAGNVSKNTWILLILSTPVYVFAADIFHVKAFLEVRLLWFRKNTYSKRFLRFGSMNLLTCLGTSVSYFASIILLILDSRQEPEEMAMNTSYFDLVVFLTFFLLIGRLLESLSKSKTADAISDLSKLKVKQATLAENGSEIVDVKYLEIDDIIRVVPGDSPPVDCSILEGTTEFDESALTGESKPVKHVPGHQIFSGTVNCGNEAVVAKVTGLEGDSLIDQIVNTVRDGQLRKAPIARTAEILTSYFVPFIILLAIITWVIWLVLGLTGSLPPHYLDIEIGGWAIWSLEFSIAVFVIACPCGLALAAPTALFVGSGLAAKYGILARGGGIAFQDGANTNVVCFDKTGTLTYGELKVIDYAFFQMKDQKFFPLQVTRDLELISKHPIAKSVKEFLSSSEHGMVQISGRPAVQNKIPQVESIPGKGLKGEVVIESGEKGEWVKFNGSKVILGNEKLMNDFGVKISAAQGDLLNKWKLESKSMVLVAVQSEGYFHNLDYHFTFALSCRDRIRAETKTVIEYLQRSKIDCWMITGDNELTANAIGQEINILPDRIISEVLPDEKQAQVQRIQKMGDKKKIVAMVGDGINDAPALSTADVGIALSSGADLAVTSSDFIILNKTNPLITLVTLFDLSRTVFRRVKFNFCWSLVYNMIGIPIAAGVIYPYHNLRLSPVWASAAMALSSISVVMSSLALRLYRPKIKSMQGKGELNIEDETPTDFTE